MIIYINDGFCGSSTTLGDARADGKNKKVNLEQASTR